MGLYQNAESERDGQAFEKGPVGDNGPVCYTT